MPKKSLTHLQVLVEQTQLAEVHQNIVLLPAAVTVVRIVMSLSAAPPVTHQPTRKPNDHDERETDIYYFQAKIRTDSARLDFFKDFLN